jgi:hypothetical protein
VGRFWVLASAALPKGHAILGREPMVLGREPACELRVFSPDVSRRHARIARAGVSYAIQDLGSSNGTFVNGRSADKPRVLENGDLVAVGMVQLKFAIVDGERDDVAQRFQTALDETDQVLKAAGSLALFSGKFTRDTIYQVCQLIEIKKHAGVLRVQAGGSAGYLRFKEGLIVDARLGPVTGERAARALLGLLSGDYTFHAWQPGSPGAQPAGGPLRLHAIPIVLDLLLSEKERAQVWDGFSDERPTSAEKPGLPEEPPEAGRTHILRRPKPE